MQTHVYGTGAQDGHPTMLTVGFHDALLVPLLREEFIVYSMPIVLQQLQHGSKAGQLQLLSPSSHDIYAPLHGYDTSACEAWYLLCQQLVTMRSISTRKCIAMPISTKSTQVTQLVTKLPSHRIILKSKQPA